MFVSDASERNCSSAAAFALPLRGSEGLEAGACEERAERRGVPLTELRFERRCSGEDILKVEFCAVEVGCAGSKGFGGVFALEGLSLSLSIS